MTVLRRLVACAVLVAACAARPSPPPAPAPSLDLAPMLLIEAGEVGDETLTLLDVATGATAPVALPAGGARLLAPGWAPIVAAAQGGSSVALGRRAGEDAIAWEVVDVGSAAPGRVVGTAVAPNGARVVAALAVADPRRPYDVVTLDLASRGTAVVRVDAELDGVPVWIDEGRVAVPTIGRGDVRTFTIVNVEDGSQRSQPTELADLTRSADGRFASGTAIYGPRVFELADPDAAVVATIGAVEGYGAAALDRDGVRLAVVLEDEAGDAIAIAIWAESAGWNEEARFAIPGGAKRAFVTWLD